MDPLRAVLTVEIIALFALRLAFERRGAAARRYEAPAWVAGMSLVAVVQVAALTLAALAPERIAFAALELPLILRWGGVALGAGALGLLSWTHRTLGRHYSSVLHLAADHELITSGPYAQVRHPMYTALFALFLAFGLASANLLVAGSCLGGLALVVFRRLPAEERLLRERFGARYLDWEARTARFIP